MANSKLSSKTKIIFIFMLSMPDCSHERIPHGYKVAASVPAIAHFHPTSSPVHFSF
jgi:hypothetical protein